MNTYDFCNEYLYKPLNIKSCRWFTSPDGVCYTIPGNNYNGTDGNAEEAKSDLSARDMAKIRYFNVKQASRRKSSYPQVNHQEKVFSWLCRPHFRLRSGAAFYA